MTTEFFKENPHQMEQKKKIRQKTNNEMRSSHLKKKTTF